MVNIFALISICCFAASIVMMAFVYNRDTKGVANRTYMVLCLFLSVYALTAFGYRQSHSYEEAYFWWRLDFVWPMLPALMVHFVFALAELDKLLKNKFLLSVIYIPALFFCGIELTTDWITAAPVERYYGWTYGVPEGNFVYTASYGWTYLCFLVTLAVGIRMYRTADAFQKRKQAKFLVLGVFTSLLGAITEVVFYVFNNELPPLFIPSFLLTNFFFGWSIVKYDLFNLTPSSAAESIVTTMPDALLLVSSEGLIISTNRAAEILTDRTTPELRGLPVKDIFDHDAKLPIWLERIDPSKKIPTLETKDVESTFRNVKVGSIPVSIASSMLRDDKGNLLGFVIIARDITERRKAALEISRHQTQLEDLVARRTAELTRANQVLEKEIQVRLSAEETSLQLEAQLHHAQKMEAIGRLAGGVAHDFNNLLYVINGLSSGLLLEQDLPDSIREDLQEIREAGRRATALTKQLLAFSRKQVIDPKVIDLNKKIVGAKKMLSRLVGEDMDIDFKQGKDLGKVMMDPMQLDQILANLIVNARDAMPQGGSLVMATSNVLLNEADCVGSPERRPGAYALLSVKDTGCGMGPDIVSKIFEPFFTTKSVGQGTGLGLSTVYGIVKQNAGFIEVKSELNVGTVFHIFIPHVEQSILAEAAIEEESAYRGSETIMLVEDNPMVRRLAKRQMEQKGYRVLEASNGIEALDVVSALKGEIDLLLADVVMPRMNGKELADALRDKNPKLKVIYMSGYNEEIIDRHGIVKEDVPFISKPFDSIVLLKQLRDVL